MRIVVLGSTGMAGHVVSTYLQEHGHDVYRTSRSEKNTDKSAAIDVTDFSKVGEFIDKARPDAIVNCIGLLQKACDARPDMAVLINAYLPHWLENRFKNSQTRIIHLSTDCVFSGAKGSYEENDLPDGRIMYDRSKSLGELCNDKDLTLRQSIIGPDIDPHGTGLFNWFMAQNGEIQGWTGAIWSGVTTIELARGINAALNVGLAGLYHFVPSFSINKFDLLNIIKGVFQRDDIIINKTEGLAVDKSLINTRNDFDFQISDYSRQIADMKAWVMEHRAFYPHYFR